MSADKLAVEDEDRPDSERRHHGFYGKKFNIFWKFIVDGMVSGVAAASNEEFEALLRLTHIWYAEYLTLLRPLSGFK